MLTASEILNAAARAHAGYLDTHREPGETGQGVSAHSQQPGQEGFSGVTPAERALAVGYPHREVLENVSMGYPDTASALEGLMSAIYHRLTFLDLEADELGAAVGTKSRVFLLGRKDLSRHCAEPSPGSVFRQPLDCLGRAMTRDYYDNLCAELPAEARFRPPHPVSCPNGNRLDTDFMRAFCDSPPPEALFGGYGQYYLACDGRVRVDAGWFDALCADPPPFAAYRASGKYYEICEPPQRVASEWLERHCMGLPPNALYDDSGRYRKTCAGDQLFRVEYLEALDAAKQQASPHAVIWPPHWAVDVPPAFFIEEPDPLPDLNFSGYPVSIQFNPLEVDRVEMRQFSLYRVDGGRREAVTQTRLLDQSSDPNGLLSSHEFALFPLTRLAWGGRYLVEVEAELDGEAWQTAWQFDIKGTGLPVLNVTADRQRFDIRPGMPILLYLPPRDGQANSVLRTRTEHLRGNRVTLKAVDPHTLEVEVEARYCDRIDMRFDDGRSVELIPLGCPG